jgi:hypothetical protein
LSRRGKHRVAARLPLVAPRGPASWERRRPAPGTEAEAERGRGEGGCPAAGQRREREGGEVCCFALERLVERAERTKLEMGLNVQCSNRPQPTNLWFN